MKKDVKILVATHKLYLMPQGEMYVPIEVGAATRKNHFGCMRDDEGENISVKNARFCELTALYLAWKNLKNEYVGLVQYRRHFGGKAVTLGNECKRIGKVIAAREIDKLLEKSDVILPRKRQYYIENLYDHYTHTLEAEPLEITGEIIAEKYPEYLAEFEKLHQRRSAHMFNMMVMKKDVLDGYCEWLFGILFELEKRIGERGIWYGEFQNRFYGRVAELLLDVYIRTKNIKYEEVRTIDIEPVNWLKKGGSFVAAKMLRRKYHESF